MSAGRVIVVIDRRMALIKCYASREVPVRLEPVAYLLPPPVHADRLPRPPEGYRRCCACNVLRPATAEKFRPSSQGVLLSQCIECEDRAARTRPGRKSQPSGIEVTA